MTPRRLAVFTDGTWNRPDQEDRGRRKPSNVSKLARAVIPVCADGTSQLVYYAEGVGTHWSVSDRWLGGGFGVGLLRNVVEAYQWIVYNYAEGDSLYLFGFSRGAYTARSLAGLIELVGLLPKSEAFFIPEAQQLYVDRASEAQAAEFRAKHRSRTARIRFLGVWDTVGALGVPVPLFNALSRKRYEFHDVQLGGLVDHARHALAIDEVRGPFRPSLWAKTSHPGQTVEQRWFAGVHTNIGGGYDNDGLANVPLHWMKREAAAQGLELDEEFLKPYRPWFGDELRTSYKGAYRLLPRYERPIGTTWPETEIVDPSAYDRVRKVADYRPKNLLERARLDGVDLGIGSTAPRS